MRLRMTYGATMRMRLKRKEREEEEEEEEELLHRQELLCTVLGGMR